MLADSEEVRVSKSFAAFLTTSTALLAQATFVVDPANGPGTNYTALQAAVNAVPSGSILLVRPGTYPKTLIDGKGLTILCDAGVTASATLDWYLQIRNTTTSQPVYVRGLRPVGATAFEVTNAAGPVCIDGQGASPQVTGIPIYQSPTIQSSAQVAVRGFTLRYVSPTIVVGSKVVFEQCTFHGQAQVWFAPNAYVGPAAALSSTNSVVQLVNCSAFGGVGTSVPGSAAITLDQTSFLRVTGSGQQMVGGNVAAFAGPGTVRIDPTMVVGTPATSGGTVIASLAMSRVLASDAPPGGSLGATRYATSPDAFFLLIGVAAPAVVVPFVPLPVWFDPAAFAVHAAGIGPTATGFATTLPVPNTAALRGAQFVWHSLDLTPSGSWDLSSPSPTIVQ